VQRNQSDEQLLPASQVIESAKELRACDMPIHQLLAASQQFKYVYLHIHGYFYVVVVLCY